MVLHECLSPAQPQRGRKAVAARGLSLLFDPLVDVSYSRPSSNKGRHIHTARYDTEMGNRGLRFDFSGYTHIAL